MQFMAFGREIPCETTATQKVTVRPSIHTTAGNILIIVSLINIFGSDTSENQTCVSSHGCLESQTTWVYPIFKLEIKQ